MVVIRCDKCEKIIVATRKSHIVSLSDIVLTRRYDLCEECSNKLVDWFNGIEEPEPAERDCEHCIHHSDNGCESWECKFERR